LALALGRLDAAPGFTSVPGRKVRITAPASQSGDPPPTKPAEPVQCDGDDVTRLPVEVEVVPEALGLVVPREGPYG
jgi:diacylglycerol kinase family enzyme